MLFHFTFFSFIAFYFLNFLESVTYGHIKGCSYFEIGMCVSSVSYTHLDVYKRQVLNSTGDTVASMFVTKISGEKFIQT